MINLGKPLVPTEGVHISMFNPNMFLFKFFHAFDFDRITDSRPWTLDGKMLVWSLLVLREIPSSLCLNTTPFVFSSTTYSQGFN